MIGVDGVGLGAGVDDEFFDDGVRAKNKYAGRFAAPEGASNKHLHIFGEHPFLDGKVFGVLFID